LADHAKRDDGSGGGSGAEASRPWWRPRINLAVAILIGLLLGVGAGLFFGEACAALKPIGDAYIGLIQMTVLPYITFALIASIGGLTMQTARRLAVKGLGVMVVLWVIGLITVILIPLSYPEFKTASFFSTSLIESPTPVNYLLLYIPSNPFASLASSLVPAVVLFSLVTGVALIGIGGKERLIDPLQVAVEALGRINLFVVKLTPIGVFAMAAAAAGTLTPAELGRLQAYLIGYVFAALLLALWVLPMLVASLTPFGYRQVLRATRDAAVTAFATENVFIVLPLLAHSAQKLLAQGQADGTGDAEPAAEIEVLVPVSYTFPNLGKILALTFVPFAAWFLGRPLGIDDYPPFTVTGLGSLFAQSSVAMPFLLDFMRLPADMFQLFILSGLICGRFGSLVVAVNLFAFAILTACLMRGMIRVRRNSMLTMMGVTLVVIIGVTVGERAYLRYSMEGQYRKDQVLSAMQLLEDPVEHVVLEDAAPNPDPLQPDESRLQRIRRRGRIRVGFRADALPWTFFNGRGELVGLDIELMHVLAGELGVAIEFVPTTRQTSAEQMQSDHFDLLVSGVPMSLTLSERSLLTGPYLELTPALVVADYRRDEFETNEMVRETPGLRIGGIDDPYLIQRAGTWLPQAEIVPITSLREFFDGEIQGLDAVLSSAEGGSAWTLLHPEYSVVLSATAEVIEWPLCIPVAGRDRHLAQFLDDWIEIKTQDGTVKEAFEHWILGRTAEDEGPRWSIVRDVLGWGE
jgi:Na+/H+-dicarboxylate symporter